MRTHQSELASVVLVLFLSFFACRADGGGDIYAQDAEEVRGLLPEALKFPTSEAGQVYDLSKLSLETALEGTGYQVKKPPNDYHFGDYHFGRRAVGRYISFVSEDEENRAEVKMLLYACHGSPEDAQVMMFSDMAGTSMMINASTYEHIVKGPGEMSFTWGTPLHSAHRPKVIDRLWFYRKSVAVRLWWPKDTDLLPIALAVDDALKECPVVDIEQLKKELPDVATKEPLQIGEPDERTYRVDFTLPSPLKKHQSVVAVSPAPRAQFRIEEDHIVITLTEGDQLPKFSVGVYDANTVWVKWQDEGGPPREEDENSEKHGEE